MFKFMLVLAVALGCMFAINVWMPGLWTSGFSIASHSIRWAYVVIGAVTVIAWRKIK